MKKGEDEVETSTEETSNRTERRRVERMRGGMKRRVDNLMNEWYEFSQIWLHCKRAYVSWKGNIYKYFTEEYVKNNKWTTAKQCDTLTIHLYSIYSHKWNLLVSSHSFSDLGRLGNLVVLTGLLCQSTLLEFDTLGSVLILRFKKSNITTMIKSSNITFSPPFLSITLFTRKEPQSTFKKHSSCKHKITSD